MKRSKSINFPEFTGIRYLMMPFIQGDSQSIPDEYKSYSDIIDSTFIKKGDIGYLTIDELPVSKYGRFNDDLDDILTGAFKENPNLVSIWNKLDELLPTNLRHFAKDLDHLKFFQNTDVQNALKWVKDNRSNLFTDYPSLSPGEITALNYYSTTEGYQINFWLRNKPIKSGVEWSTAHANNYLKFLDDAFDK